MPREYQHGTPTKVAEIRKGDNVVVIVGKDAGKRGTVDKVITRTAAPTSARSSYRRGTNTSGTAVVVDGLNIAKRHTKPRQSTSSTTSGPQVQPGGILEVAQPLDISKVMLVCPKCDKPTRIKHSTLADGKRIRVCAHCGSPLEVKA
jgi:large subunit ribosomal protein L24